MSMSIQMLMFGDVQFERKLEDMADRAENLSPVMEVIRDDMIEVVEGQFDTEGARSGNPWDPLSRDWKFRRGSAHPILIHSGDLLDALLTPAHWNVSDSGVEYGGSHEADEYGKFHQTGTTKMPQRKILDLTPVDRGRITRKVKRYLVEGVL